VVRNLTVVDVGFWLINGQMAKSEAARTGEGQEKRSGRIPEMDIQQINQQSWPVDQTGHPHAVTACWCTFALV